MPNYTATLSIPDQEMPLVLTTMWLVFKVDDPEAAANALRVGVNKTATQMPFLSGELWADPDDGYKAKISWSDEGLSSIPCEELPGDDLPSYNDLDASGMQLHKIKDHDFYGPNLTSMMKSSHQPAFYTSYTKVQGGLIVLFAAHHSLVDGTGRENIISTIALNIQGLAVATNIIHPAEPFGRDALLQKMKTEKLLVMEEGSTHSPNLMESSIHGSSPTISSTLFRWSIRKLDEMREQLRQHTELPFTLSSMVTALLWTLTIGSRVHTAEHEFPSKSPFEGQFSYLYMSCNLRGLLLKAGLLSERKEIRNLISFLEPYPRIAYDSISLIDQETISLQLSGHVLTCPTMVPGVIDNISRTLMNMKGDDAIARWAGNYPAPPGFDHRRLRDLSFLFKGTNFDVANWSSLNMLIDFGAAMGHYPTHVRMLPSMIDGLVHILPRFRDPRCGPDLLDRFDAMFSLKDTNMDEILNNPLVKALDA